MATPQRFARRGYGRAILADVLLRAKLEGASIGLLGATPAGKALYDSTGWTTLEDWRMFLTPDAASAH
jgi:GNAT superfamily N-acetyltransferase